MAAFARSYLYKKYLIIWV